MLASDLYDPLDGAFFRATLTEDWRVFVPEKPLALNALLALTLLESGRRAEAVRALDFLLSACFCAGRRAEPLPHRTAGKAAPLRRSRSAPRSAARTACAPAACWGCAASTPGSPPKVTPSRFSPVEDSARDGSAAHADAPRIRSPRRTPPFCAGSCRSSCASAPPERRRPPRPASSARIAPWPRPCSRCAADGLGEARYIQAAQRAVGCLTALSPGLPAVVFARVSATQRPAHLRRGRGAGAGAADAGTGRRAGRLPRKRSAPSGRGAACRSRPGRHADAHPAGRGGVLPAHSRGL